MRKPWLALIVTLVSLAGAGPLWPLPDWQWGFERPSEDWGPCVLDRGTGQVTLSTARATEGKSALAVGGTLPGSFGVTYRPWDDWTGYEQLSFDLYVPKGAPKGLDLWVYLKDKQYYWYQTAPFRSPKTGKLLGTLPTGKWVTIRLDISPRSTIWQPGGHRRAWERTLYYPREFGLRFFAGTKWAGTVYLDNLRLTGNAVPLGPYASGSPRILKDSIKLTASAAQVPVYGKLELSFNLARDYVNPFDPQVVDVTGHFVGPDGKEVTLPGFLYQAYERSRTPEGNEKLTPVGHTCWKVRFAPRQPGKHRYWVTVRDALGLTRSAEGGFTATAAQDPRGYVRISQRDPKFFEFDNGDPFRPTGLNMRDGGDQAEAQKGTYDFDFFFRRFAEEKLNFVRTWMCAWWAGIEWSENYHSRFDGVGRYNLYNAWRLDHALELARQHDLRLELTLNSHGQMRRDKFDAEWMYNPYSVRNGGMVASPAMFFTSPTARALVKQRLRYIVARWGYSPHLMSFDLVNEVDLTEGYNREQVAAWHKEMATYLRNLDPWKHLVCTHICLYGNFGDELWQLPEIDYIQADAYWKRRDVGMNECWAAKKGYNKPFFFIEYGPQTVSLPLPFETWQQDFRVGMWVSNLIPSAAPGQFWYHQEWEQFKLWRYQKGLLAFNRGEDRRGKNLVSLNAFARSQGQGVLNVQAMGNGAEADFYLYRFENLAYPEPAQVPEAQRIPGATVWLMGMQDGTYRAEFWDTLAGQPVGVTDCQVQAGALAVPVPAFAADLACKIRRKG